MSKAHELKTWPQYFRAVLDGSKTFEVRRDDRDFSVGDILWLREYQPWSKEYTGADIRQTVTYVMRGIEAAQFGVEEGFAVLAIRATKQCELDALTGASNASR